MSKRSKRSPSGIVPAFALACFTLFIFFFTQNSGPESAVLRYHEAIQLRDPQRLQSVTARPIDEAASIEIQTRVAQVMGVYRSLRISRAFRDGDRAIVQVIYRLPNDQATAINFAVVRERDQWRVYPAETLRQNMSMPIQNPTGRNLGEAN